MKILLHTCCAPCLIAPYERLANNKLTLFYYNPNIHPFDEFHKRLMWVEQFATEAQMDLITYHYNPNQYLEQVAFDVPERCEICYKLRITETARVARLKGFEAFTTTMLASPHQKHNIINDLASEAAKKYDIPFYYEDFRPYYQEAVKKSKELGVYRQKYCGCVYSLKEREAQLKNHRLRTRSR